MSIDKILEENYNKEEVNERIKIIIERKERNKKMKIPNDLVLFPPIDILSKEEIEKICDQEWYEADGILLISSRAIDFLSEASPEKAGIDYLKSARKIQRIPHCLKRFNEKDGFYYA
jgi:hypothetical protein